MKQKDIQILIVPDVHGRVFWREPVQSHPDKPVVFLGDYLDPYGDEHISDDQAVSILKDIIALKRSRPDSVHLLLGNHDMAYIDARIGCGRHRWLDEFAMKCLYKDAPDCFELAYDQTIGDKRFLFSHAGISMGWLSLHKDIFGKMPMCAALFDLMYKTPDLRDFIIEALTDVSIARWGQSKFGSMIWADVLEMMDPRMQLPGFIQVFGHSQQEIEPCCLKDHAYCLDCRRVFYIDSAGDIRDYDTDRVVGEDRYVFLDIDGTVTSGRSHYYFDPDCFDCLGRILDATDARIVITSSWKGRTVKETIRYLTDTRDPFVAGHPFPFCDKIVGVTRDWPVVDDDYTRGKEVDAYLKQHSCSSYVILDDIQDFMPEQLGHFVCIHDSTGICDDDVSKAVDILLK